jgi:hypothetical protein
MTVLSKLLYYVANPLLMPVYTLLLLFQLETGAINTTPPSLRTFLYIFSFVICTIFPLFSIAGLKFTRAIKSFHLEHREDRIGPYILTIIYYCIAYYMLRFKFGIEYLLPSVVYSSLLGAIVSICLVAIINLKTKISAHSVGVAGVLATLIVASGKYYVANSSQVSWMIAATMLLVGVTATSRLWLKAHNESQVYFGLLLGFIVEFVFVSYDIVI